MSYLAGFKSVCAYRPSVRPSDPDTMTNTAQEAVASSNGKKSFVPVAVAAAAEADIDDSIKPKRIRVSLKNAP